MTNLRHYRELDELTNTLHGADCAQARELLALFDASDLRYIGGKLRAELLTPDADQSDREVLVTAIARKAASLPSMSAEEIEDAAWWARHDFYDEHAADLRDIPIVNHRGVIPREVDKAFWDGGIEAARAAGEKLWVAEFGDGSDDGGSADGQA